jgi:hypothetical protein
VVQFATEMLSCHAEMSMPNSLCAEAGATLLKTAVAAIAKTVNRRTAFIDIFRLMLTFSLRRNLD